MSSCVYFICRQHTNNAPVKDEVVVCIYRVSEGNKAREKKSRRKNIDYTDTTWWKRFFFFFLCTYVFIYSFVYSVWRMGSSREKWQLNIVLYLWHSIKREYIEHTPHTHINYGWKTVYVLYVNRPSCRFNVYIVWWWCWWRWFFWRLPVVFGVEKEVQWK